MQRDLANLGKSPKTVSEGMYDKHHVDMTDNSFVHTFLSEQAQGAEKVEPGFIFPFYGHLVHNFYVTTHGFISFAPRIHNLMYKTQYIAPLRVKLDPSRYNESTLNYKLHGPFDNSLTVQWTNVSVAEPFEHPMGGKFTFQVISLSTYFIFDRQLNRPQARNELKWIDALLMLCTALTVYKAD